MIMKVSKYYYSLLMDRYFNHIHGSIFMTFSDAENTGNIGILLRNTGQIGIDLNKANV